MDLAAEIRKKIVQKRDEYINYQQYVSVRLDHEDLHAVWDAAVNMSEVSNYIDALQWCLEMVMVKELEP